MDHFTATTDPVFGSVAVSAIVALIPLLTFFVLLAFLKVKAHFAGGISLLVAIAVAMVLGLIIDRIIAKLRGPTPIRTRQPLEAGVNSEP